MMAIDLGRPFSPDYVGVPVGMPPADLQLWRRWRQRADFGVDAWYFNVRVGEGAGSPVDTTPALASMWLQVTQKRIDVVGRGATNTWIIELHSGANASAVGRLQLYRLLWEANDPWKHRNHYWLISDNIDSERDQLAQSVNLSVLIV